MDAASGNPTATLQGEDTYTTDKTSPSKGEKESTNQAAPDAAVPAVDEQKPDDLPEPGSQPSPTPAPKHATEARSSPSPVSLPPQAQSLKDPLSPPGIPGDVLKETSAPSSLRRSKSEEPDSRRVSQKRESIPHSEDDPPELPEGGAELASTSATIDLITPPQAAAVPVSQAQSQPQLPTNPLPQFQDFPAALAAQRQQQSQTTGRKLQRPAQVQQQPASHFPPDQQPSIGFGRQNQWHLQQPVAGAALHQTQLTNIRPSQAHALTPAPTSAQHPQQPPHNTYAGSPPRPSHHNTSQPISNPPRTSPPGLPSAGSYHFQQALPPASAGTPQDPGFNILTNANGLGDLQNCVESLFYQAIATYGNGCQFQRLFRGWVVGVTVQKRRDSQ